MAAFRTTHGSAHPNVRPQRRPCTEQEGSSVKISVCIEVNPYLAVAAVTALLFTGLITLTTADIQGAGTDQSMLTALALSIALAASQASRRPRV